MSLFDNKGSVPSVNRKAYQLKKTGGVGVPANCDIWAVDY